MQPPSDQLRAHVAATTADWTASNLPAQMTEDLLEQMLDEIESEMEAAEPTVDLAADMGEEVAENELANLNAWAGLISHAVARVYAPASPWPLAIGGWSAKITKRLQRMVRILRRRLQPIANALHAAHFSISVGFPWGVSVGMSF